MSLLSRRQDSETARQGLEHRASRELDSTGDTQSREQPESGRRAVVTPNVALGWVAIVVEGHPAER